MSSDIDFRVEQFEKFYDLLMSNAPEGYKPWFFPCKKNDKNPDTLTILKINNSSKGSWHHESARLSKEQAIELIKQEHNIGISARENDALIIGDIDSPEYISQVPYTLTTTSRKRCGVHFFGWDKDGSAKKNIPTNDGELRSNNQYVLACGSYVPFNLESEKDKKAFDNLTDEAKNDKYLGYYTIRTFKSPEKISFGDLPQLYKNRENEKLESDIKTKHIEENKEFKGEGKYSELFKLKVSDIIGAIPQKQRFGHPLHDSDTDANFSLSKDGTIGHCWRHFVSLNAVQYLCVKAGYMNCEDAGTPHGNKSFSKIKGDKKAYEVAYNEALKMGLIKEWEGNKNDFIIFKINKKTGKSEFDKVDIDAVSEYIENKFNIRTIYGDKGEDIEVYENGIWTQKGKGLIKSEIENILTTSAKISVVNEILEKIKRRTEVPIADTLETPENKVCLKNGVLDLEDVDNIKVIDFSPKFNFRTKLNVEYNPSIKDCLFEKIINETVEDNDILKFQEWCGFHLSFRYSFKKFAIIYGPRNTAKSLIVNWLSSFLNQNISGLSLQDIAKRNSFDLLSLKDKFANICDDLSSNDMSSTGGVKIAVGDGYITGEKKFGDRISFRNSAKLTFTCNNIPYNKDDNDDDAYFGRILLFKFDNVILKDKMDKDLINKMTTDDELSGALNWFIDGYKRLVKQNFFSNDLEPEETKYRMLSNGKSNLSEFADYCLRQSDGDKITKEELYSKYCEWCFNHKPRLSPETKDKVGKTLIKFVPYILSKGGNERIWLNVKFNDSYDSF